LPLSGISFPLTVSCRGLTKLLLLPEKISDVVWWQVAPVPSGPDWKLPPSGTVKVIGLLQRPAHGSAGRC